MHQRGEFMSTKAFSTYTDVNDRLLETLRATPIPQINPDAYEEYRKTTSGGKYPEEVIADPAAKSLFVTALHLRQLVPIGDERFRKQHGFTAQDERQAVQHRIFGYGLENMDFPWHFSAGVANAVADFFVDEGALTGQQKEQFRLQDWAAMIESDWFGRVTHDLALTARHLHRIFGYELEHFQKNSLQKYFDKELALDGKPLFNLGWVTGQRPDEAQPIAKLDKAFNQTLKERMHSSEEKYKEQSVGCPVARKMVSLTVEDAAANSHITQLVERGTLRPVPRASADRVAFQQDDTTIDRTLVLIAGQMRRYEAAYGTPRLVPAEDSIWPQIVH